jgi:uncharacterized membrane protein
MFAGRSKGSRALARLAPGRRIVWSAAGIRHSIAGGDMAGSAPTSGGTRLLDPLRHHKHLSTDDSGEVVYAGGSSFMERVAESVASGMGTVAFVIIGSLVILGWVLINGAIPYLEQTFTNLTHGSQFDPEPWILLNLIFSGVAFYTGALVIIAQKAQSRTDTANEAASAAHREELAQFQTTLLQQNTDLTSEIHTLTKKLATLTEQVHTATCKK